MRSTLLKNRGMTLIELMVVVAVLATVTAIAIPAYTGYVTSSRIAECQNEASAIQIAEEEFFLSNNTYFAGSTKADLQNNSNGFYTATANGWNNCTYSVTLSGGGNGYTLTATGINKLAGKGTVVTITK